jgi:hypothetical protein
MDVTETRLTDLPGEVLDIDPVGDSGWVAVVEQAGERQLRFGGHAVPLPRRLEFPLVRAFDIETALVIDARSGGEENAFVLDCAGTVLASFAAGDGIEDVLVSDTWIVVTYFDEGVFSGIAPSHEGVAVFSRSGELVLGYASKFGNAVAIADCYCACWGRRDQLYFLPYGEPNFPLIHVNLSRHEHEWWPTPRDLHGSGAMTTRDGRTFLFHGPYDHRMKILRWDLNESIAEVGSHPGPLRGVRGGGFLAKGHSGFTVLEFDLA